jgi:hypothetical protein
MVVFLVSLMGILLFAVYFLTNKVRLFDCTNKPASRQRYATIIRFLPLSRRVQIVPADVAKTPFIALNNNQFFDPGQAEDPPGCGYI